MRVDRPIDKDTELHPLVRWQFQAAICRRTSGARSCSPTWSTAAASKYDMPVVVGALSASPRIYAIGMGKPLDEIGPAWIERDQPLRSRRCG